MFLKLLSKGTQGKKVKQSQKANDKLRDYYKGKISLLYKDHEGKKQKSDRKMDKNHVKMVHKREAKSL